MSRLLGLLLTLSLTLPVLGELPPLDPEVRKERADLIVIARVVKTSSEEQRVSVGKNLIYTIELAIETYEKGDYPSDLIKVRCWKADKRPSGWAGPGGQYKVPKPGSKGLFFLRQDRHGVFHMLNPNGWDRLTGKV